MTGEKVLILTAALILIFCIAEMVREQRKFRVTRYTFQTEKMPDDKGAIKAVFLSDLHNQVYGKENDRLYEAIRAENPDVIFIGGDMLVGKPKISAEAAIEFVRRLPGICPVYAANGNHEQRMKKNPAYYGGEYKRYRRILDRAGVHFLENESRLIHICGNALWVSGLELPLYTYKKFKTHHVEAKQIEKCLGKADRDALQILLAHNPAFVRAYKDWGADLILCGHLHGGMVRIPGWRGVITPQVRLFPRYSGEMRTEGKQAVVVSRGLGMHTLKIRLFNPAEVIALAISGKKD